MDKELVEEEVLDEAKYDWVNFSFIGQRIGADEGFDQGEPALSEKALAVAVDLVRTGRLVAGDLTQDGFVVWPGSVDDVADRMTRDAAEVISEYGYIPLAEVCWFATPELLARHDV